MKQAKIPILETVKWICVILLVLFIVHQSASGKESHTDFETMRAAVSEQFDMSNVLEADNQMVKRLYGIDPGTFDGLVLYYPTTNMGAEELLLVKLSDTEQQESVREAIENRLQTQKDSFEGYGIEQFDMLEKSVIDVHGNYVLYVVSSNPAAVHQAFLDTL